MAGDSSEQDTGDERPPRGAFRDSGPDGHPPLQRLRKELDRHGLGPSDLERIPEPDPKGRTLAAVLILLYPRCGAGGEPEPYLVLTRRTEALPRHGGQISLPGGRFDPGDRSLLGTALRETREELGVDPAELTIWGRLEPEWIVVSDYLVSPFIAYAQQRPDFRPAPSEVAEVIEVPLAVLLDPTTLAEEIWEIQGVERQVVFYRHREHKIWGATARVLGKLVALLTPESAQHAAARLEPGAVLPERWPGQG
jgi:8-oxo-dGTP pyrophosphatase MutT (NUDIX family)